MNSKGHLYASVLKSIIRIFGAVASIYYILSYMPRTAIIVLASSLLIAEVLGILEELLDKRE